MHTKYFAVLCCKSFYPALKTASCCCCAVPICITRATDPWLCEIYVTIPPRVAENPAWRHAGSDSTTTMSTTAKRSRKSRNRDIDPITVFWTSSLRRRISAWLAIRQFAAGMYGSTVLDGLGCARELVHISKSMSGCIKICKQCIPSEVL
jgi:hypothetical protein